MLPSTPVNICIIKMPLWTRVEKLCVIVPHGSGRLWKLGKTNSSKRIQLLLINRKLHPLSCFLTLTQISLISQERNHVFFIYLPIQYYMYIWFIYLHWIYSYSSTCHRYCKHNMSLVP